MYKANVMLMGISAVAAFSYLAIYVFTGRLFYLVISLIWMINFIVNFLMVMSFIKQQKELMDYIAKQA